MATVRAGGAEIKGESAEFQRIEWRRAGVVAENGRVQADRELQDAAGGWKSLKRVTKGTEVF